MAAVYQFKKRLLTDMLVIKKYAFITASQILPASAKLGNKIEKFNDRG